MFLARLLAIQFLPKKIAFSRCCQQSASHLEARDASPTSPHALESRTSNTDTTDLIDRMNTPFAPPGAAWQEHRTPDGRVYYFNPLTKVTQWTKPEDLMSSAEVRLFCCYGKGEESGRVGLSVRESEGADWLC